MDGAGAWEASIGYFNCTNGNWLNASRIVQRRCMSKRCRRLCCHLSTQHWSTAPPHYPATRRHCAGLALRQCVAARPLFFHYTSPVSTPLPPLRRLMQHLACLAVVLLVCAPLVSRTLNGAQRFLDAPLCQSQPDQAGNATRSVLLRAKIAGDESPASINSAALDAWPGSMHHEDHGAAHGALACDYCVLSARLLPWLLVVLLVFPLLRAAVPGEGTVAPGSLKARWRAHTPRGPPLQA